MKTNLKQLMLLGVCTMSVAMALPASAHVNVYAASYSQEFTNYTERNACVDIETKDTKRTYTYFPEGSSRLNPKLDVIKELEQTPVMINGRLFVPMRAIFEELGCTVEWDKATKTVTISRDGIEVELTIGSTTMGVNKNGTKSTVTLDAAPVVINGNTMLPLRAPAEVFGYEVRWKPEDCLNGLGDSNGRYLISNGCVSIRDAESQAKADKKDAEWNAHLAEIEAKRAAEQAEKEKIDAQMQAGYKKLGELHKEYLKKGKLTEEQFNAEVLKCMNIFRTYLVDDNLKPLTRHPLLDEAAAVRAKEVLIVHGHDRPDGSSYYTAIPGMWNQETYSSEWGNGPASAEILHWDPSATTTPASTVQHWLESPALHGTVVYDPTDNIVGIGTAYDGTYTSVIVIDVDRGPGSKH